jgi:hypothetical protein
MPSRQWPTPIGRPRGERWSMSTCRSWAGRRRWWGCSARCGCCRRSWAISSTATGRRSATGVDAAPGSALDPDVRGRPDPARRTPGRGDCSGLVGRFWRPAIEFARITSAGEVREFDEAGFAKTVYDLSVPELGASRTLLSGLMRTATTDEHARRWFRRYWTFGVGSARTSSSAPCSTRHGARPRASGTVS